VRVVAQSWTTPPSLDLVIDATVERLARLALAAHGDWTDGADDAWRRAADRACRLGRSPRLRRVPPSRQVERLARVLSPEPIGFILACGDPAPGPTRLYGMVRAVQWLAANAGGPVVLVLPADLIHHIELEAIVDRAVVLDRHPHVPAEVRDPRADVAVWPVRGAPHPFSDSEHVIVDRLERDERLARLFESNATVRTDRGAEHRVDLLWRGGKVVVEIDGWSTHRDRASFHNDRLRDYELLISGYAVLRLTHDAVLDDVEKAFDMINDVVQLRGGDARTTATTTGGVPERASR
jgi:very-short-patch-repair endonuclease